MSDKINNYIEETKPLFRLLRTEAFRFIIIRYNHYSLINRLKADLLQLFPDRPAFTVNGRDTNYRLLVDSYYKAARGFFYIENFEEVLANPEIYSGLNQRRDKLAQYPIALIVFISFGTEELYARQIMEKMPDLWSFRALLLDLKVEISLPVQPENWNHFITPDQVLSTSTLGGSTPEEKELELKRLLKRVMDIHENELGLLNAFYEQIARLYEDLYIHDKAIEYYLKLEKIEIEIGDNTGLGTTYNQIGFIYSKMGEYNKSLEYFLKSEKIRSELGDKAALGTAYNNIGGYYSNIGNYEKALNFYLKAEKMFLESGYDEGLGAAYNNIGQYYMFKNEWEKALGYLLKSERILGDTEKSGLGIRCFNLGIVYSNLGDFNKSLESYEKSGRIRFEVGDDLGLIQTIYSIGLELLRNNSKEKAVDFFNLAGYLAKKKGMDSELVRMAWAIDPLVKELGNDKFMEEGGRLYDQIVLQQGPQPILNRSKS